MSFDKPTGERGKFVYDQVKKKFLRYKPEKKVVSIEILKDEIEGGIESMATHARQRFTSKKRYRDHLKVHGFVETGGDHLQPPSRSSIRDQEEKEERDRREDLEKAYFDVKYGKVEFTEQEKELHLREERICKMNKIPKLKAPY